MTSFEVKPQRAALVHYTVYIIRSRYTITLRSLVRAGRITYSVPGRDEKVLSDNRQDGYGNVAAGGIGNLFRTLRPIGP